MKTSPAGVKTCTKCGEDYPATPEYFYQSSDRGGQLYSQCIPCRLERSRHWYANNRESRLRKGREYYEANREEYVEKHRQHYEANRGQFAIQHRLYHIAHRDRLREARGESERKPKFRLHKSVSVRMRRSLVAGKDGSSWEDLVGYSLPDLMAHLESQFTKGMTWDNYGAWHIDHIRPVTDFNFETSRDPEFKECWSLWNLQPLWAFDNLSKGGKCENPPLPLLHEEGN